MKTWARADAGAWLNYTFLTRKERDNETGLDYFLARYYSSTQGRFTSPDEFKGGPDELFVLGTGDEEKQALPYAEIANPHSLNKYTYVYNNPLRFIDPDGHQGDDGIVTRLLRWFSRQLDPQQEAEQPRRGPMSIDGDKVAAQATQEFGKRGLATAETLEKFRRKRNKELFGTFSGETPRFSKRPTLDELFADAKRVDPTLEKLFRGKLNQDKTPLRIYQAYWDYKYPIKEIADFLNVSEHLIKHSLDESDEYA